MLIAGVRGVILAKRGVGSGHSEGSGRPNPHKTSEFRPQICTIFYPDIPYRLFESCVHVAADKLVSLPITRNSSGDEIANVNFLYDDIVHALKIQ